MGTGSGGCGPKTGACGPNVGVGGCPPLTTLVVVNGEPDEDVGAPFENGLDTALYPMPSIAAPDAPSYACSYIACDCD